MKIDHEKKDEEAKKIIKKIDSAKKARVRVRSKCN